MSVIIKMSGSFFIVVLLVIWQVPFFLQLILYHLMRLSGASYHDFDNIVK